MENIEKLFSDCRALRATLNRMEDAVYPHIVKITEKYLHIRKYSESIGDLKDFHIGEQYVTVNFQSYYGGEYSDTGYNIRLKYFINPEVEFPKLEKAIDRQIRLNRYLKQSQEEKQKKRNENAEYRRYLALKKKFELGN